MIPQIYLLLMLMSAISAAPEQTNDLIEYFVELGVDGMDRMIRICDEYDEKDFKIAYQYFKKADENNDGKVNLKETTNLLGYVMNIIYKYIIDEPDFDINQFLLYANGMGGNIESSEIVERAITKMLLALATKKEKKYIANNEDATGTLIFLSIFTKFVKDGSISKKQFEDLQWQCEMFKNVFKSDKGDGKMDRQEIMEFVNSMKEAQQEADFNGDGKVERHELMKFIMGRHEEL